MKIDLEFGQNQLLLNPRLPSRTREIFETAWHSLVEPRYIRHVGISTSGSSGESLGRLIVLSKEAIESSARAVNERFRSGPGDIWFKSLPSFHVGGLGILVRAKLSGATVYEDREEKWQVESFASQVRAAGATLISLVPTQVFDLVQARVVAPSSVRAVIVGGGRLEESLRERARELGWPCLPSYGMTETCSQIATALSSDDPRLTLLSHAEVRTLADGRLAVRGHSLLSAQISFDPEGQPTLVDPKQDGWFVAEDRGSLDGHVLTIEGRTADFVKIGGEGVVVARLEERLERLKLEFGFRDDVAILAVEHERLGAQIILLTTGSVDGAATLTEKFNGEVAPFERIRRVESVSQIPRSPLGKLQRGLALKLLKT